ncbi:MAG: Holliday junction resolvase RuvX [Lachnospiraceae bacterium]|nr:Holliday junction resolvase RuvX [Lachnospiraceae bacterium]
MRIMGLDYGSKTVGVAMSDELLLTAQPTETIIRSGENKLRKTLARIEELIKENNVEKIVLGLPLMTDDSVGDRAQLCLDFAEKLKARTGLEVIMVDERYTTTAAEEELEEMQIKRSEMKKYVDQLAACHILEDYLHNQNLQK